MPTAALSPCVVIQGGDERAKGEVTIKDLILGATLTETKDRDEYLEEAGRGAVLRARSWTSSRRFAASSPATKPEPPWPLNWRKNSRRWKPRPRPCSMSSSAQGYEQVAPSIIQPADIFLDQIGEEIRSRTYVFTDLAGDELCLRPDLTVPVSRLYLERHPDAKAEARYCYNGPAFRFFPDRSNQAHPREFRQAGIECFGAQGSRERRCRDRAARR